MNKNYNFGAFLLAMLASLSMAGCGGAASPTISVPTTSVPTVPSVAPTNTALGAKYPAYGHAPDYTWVAGQLKMEGTCWIVTYVSPLVDIAADQYNNHF